MKIGYCSPLKYYPEISELGYDFVELSAYELQALSDEGFERFLLLYKKTGVPCIALNDYCKDSPTMVGKNFNVVEIKEYINKILDRAELLDVKYIGIGAPLIRRFDGNDQSKVEAQAEHYLSILAEEGQKRNIMILFEAVNKYRCDFVNYTHEALDYVRRVGSKNLGILLDFRHMQVMDEVIDDVRQYAHDIFHVHICGFGPGFMRPELHVDDVPILTRIRSALRQVNYIEGISVESIGETNLVKAKESLRICREVFSY